jgi:hypothetical protein
MATPHEARRRTPNQQSKKPMTARNVASPPMPNSTSSTTSSSGFELLVWPRRPRLERDIWDPGYVVGWKSSKDRTVVCAGVLPLAHYNSLEDCSKALDQLKQKASNVNDDDQETTTAIKKCCCQCLWNSLEILAIWDPTNILPRNADLNNTLLPRISADMGFPWWHTLDDEKTKSPTTMRRMIPKQLLYYNQDTASRYSHVASEFSTSTCSPGTTEWGLLILRINHAQEVLEILQSGEFPQLQRPPPPQAITCPSDQPTTSSANEKNTQSTKPDENMDQQSKQQRLTGWRRIQQFVHTQSFTLLHFKQLGASNNGQWNALSCFSFVRFIQQVRCNNNNNNNNNNDDGSKYAHICPCCGNPSIVPMRPQSAKKHAAYWDNLLTTILDMLLGILFGCVILYYLTTDTTTAAAAIPYYVATKESSLAFLTQKISWLEEFPGGFKLNVPLTQNMGHEIRNLLFLHQMFLRATFWNPAFIQSYLVPFLGSIGIFCGWTSLLAVIVDLQRLEMLHITILAVCFRTLYKAELYLLAALWRLFRGRKRNVLRHRTDTMEYDAMQLLVGTICFCICIFLWTTIWVYYTFFVFWNICLHLPIVALWLFYALGRSIPWASLFWRMTRQHSDWFSKNVHLEKVLDGEVCVTRLVSVPEVLPIILLGRAAVKEHLKRLVTWWISFSLEILIPRNLNQSPCWMPLADLIGAFSSSSAGERRANYFPHGDNKKAK